GLRRDPARAPAPRAAAAPAAAARPVEPAAEPPPKRRRQVHLAETAADGGRGEVPGAAAAAREAVAGDPEWPELEPHGSGAGGPVPLPDLAVLHDAAPESVRIDPAALNGAADLLEGTLRSFGVEGEVKDVRPGPVVTTFEYQPASGIKVTQIVQRADDLALAMRARSIRMEAPIPGKAAVGIEIPNPQAQIVRLKEVLLGAGERLDMPLSVVLGKDVVGQPVVIDLAAQPHLLVAGSTGSGKSVCLNAIICNLLLRNDPSRVRLVLIDPKMLEMSVYNGIPHLLLPVVTDPKEALRALKWMEAQMDHRYRRLARHSVRNIEGYNAKVAKGEIVTEEGETITEPMPYYLTIVDELADLMMQLGQDFELPITRLAQKARAVGIHLILATQRPSVDVLTGVIKANIPCRIAFRVIQKNDSRTILDLNGAERLLGHGDMLYLQPGRALPVRVHGAFLELEECEAIVTHWRRFADLTRPVQLAEEREGGDSEVRGEDDLFEAAKRVVVLHQSGSTSLLQRRLRVGYTRAGRLMDMLEEAGIVGPFTGSKAREVLLRPEDLGETVDPLALEEEE
ncbi:MAG: DNA translocase FtsK, partial [Candidatus Krumholzibacteriia bacterium]